MKLWLRFLALLAFTPIVFAQQTVTLQPVITCTAQPLTFTIPAGPVVTPPPVIPPVTGTRWQYDGTGKNLWNQDYSWDAVADYKDTSGGPVGTPYDIKVTVLSAWGGYQPSNNNGVVIQVKTGYMELDLKPTQPGQIWKLIAHKSDDESNTGPTLDLANFGPAPVVGQWGHYKIPASTLMGSLTGLWKYGLADGTGHTNVWYVNKVYFTP